MPYRPLQAPPNLDLDGLRQFDEDQAREVERAWTEMEADNVALANRVTAFETLPVFMVQLGTQHAAVSGAYTKVLFDIVVFDTAGYWNAASKVYKPLRSGYYAFGWGLYTGNSVALSRLYSASAKNTVAYAYGSDTASGSAISAGTAEAFMNGTTDVMEVGVFASATTPIVGATGSPTVTMFYGRWVRP